MLPSRSLYHQCSGIKETCVQILGLPPTCCVYLGNSDNLICVQLKRNIRVLLVVNARNPNKIGSQQKEKERKNVWINIIYWFCCLPGWLSLQEDSPHGEAKMGPCLSRYMYQWYQTIQLKRPRVSPSKVTLISKTDSEWLFLSSAHPWDDNFG